MGETAMMLAGSHETPRFLDERLHWKRVYSRDVPQFQEEVVEIERSAPPERKLQLTAVQVAEMFRERYGDRDACLNAPLDLKAQLAARWEIMYRSDRALAVPFPFLREESVLQTLGLQVLHRV